MPAMSGVISRVFANAETNPENASAPISCSALNPSRPTWVPVKKLIAKMTPTVPAPTSRAPAPIVMSEMCRTISRQRRSENGMSPSAFA